MLVSARSARAIVIDAWRGEHGAAPQALMVGPQPVTPFGKQVIVDAGTHYRVGEFHWLGEPRVTFSPDEIPKNAARAEARQARETPPFRSFLVWSRFPFYELRDAQGGTRVVVGDMRFSLPNPLRAAIGNSRFTASVVIPRE
jgi:hypothetical protein